MVAEFYRGLYVRRADEADVRCLGEHFRYAVTGDFAPEFYTGDNHEVASRVVRVLRERGRHDLADGIDPERSCFYAYAPTREGACTVVDVLVDEAAGISGEIPGESDERGRAAYRIRRATARLDAASSQILAGKKKLAGERLLDNLERVVEQIEEPAGSRA